MYEKLNSHPGFEAGRRGLLIRTYLLSECDFNAIAFLIDSDIIDKVLSLPPSLGGEPARVGAVSPCPCVFIILM